MEDCQFRAQQPQQQRDSSEEKREAGTGNSQSIPSSCTAPPEAHRAQQLQGSSPSAEKHRQWGHTVHPLLSVTPRGSEAHVLLTEGRAEGQLFFLAQRFVTSLPAGKQTSFLPQRPLPGSSLWLTSLSDSTRTWSYSLSATKNMMEVTFSKQWIHFLRSDL